MIIDHICFAVKSLSESITYWKEVFGYTQLTAPVDNSRQKVRVVFLRKENSILIKLIEPAPGNRSLQNFVDHGGGFHHLCFRCDNLHEKAGELQSKGVRMLVPPQPGEAFENHDIAFFWAQHRLNFELIDTEEKASRLF
jgi:methylmalonyl-CoA/ethylmalonyl-CoA epimerase